MKFINQFATFAVAGLALCVFAPNGSAQGTSAAESACMSAVNDNYGGQVSDLSVVRSEYSEAGSVVIVQADGERFRCLSSNSGEVEELRHVNQRANRSQHQGTSAAESACMSAVNNNYGGRVNNLEVVSSEYSEAGSVVIVQADGDRFRCLSSNNGEVEDLSAE